MRTFISAITLTLSMISIQAMGAETLVQLTNGSREQLCIAVGENPRVTEGTAVSVSGWRCLGHRQSLDIRFSDVRYVMIRDSSGADYVARNPTRFPHDEGFVPIATTNTAFGLKVLARFQGGFTYSYYFESNDWSADFTSTDGDDFMTDIQNRGFRRVNAWKFSASDHPGGIGILLGEFG